MSLAGHPAVRSASRAELTRLAERVRPVALADEQVLPLLAPLRPLVPWAGLARGVTVACAGVGATSLTLALAAEASRTGSWVVAVGWAGLGLAAAAEVGVDLDHLALVPTPPPEQWPAVVAALVGAFDLVLACPPPRAHPADVRRLTARARERGTTLVLAGRSLDRWPSAPDLHLEISPVAWEGLGRGHGHLRGRRVRVAATGRRRASRPRHADLWLLDPDGRVTTAAPEATVTPLPGVAPDVTVTPLPGVAPEVTVTPLPGVAPEVTVTPLPGVAPEVPVTPLPGVVTAPVDPPVVVAGVGRTG